MQSMLSAEYVLGLVDGEGSFTVYIRHPRDSRERVRRVKAEPKFYLKLIEKDKDILYELKNFFGCGNVYFQRDRRKNHQNCYRYEVSKREDLERIIIPFFRKYRPHLASKKIDFQIFSKLVEMIKNGRHLEREGILKMYRLKQKMH